MKPPSSRGRPTSTVCARMWKRCRTRLNGWKRMKQTYGIAEDKKVKKAVVADHEVPMTCHFRFTMLVSRWWRCPSRWTRPTLMLARSCKLLWDPEDPFVQMDACLQQHRPLREFTWQHWCCHHEEDGIGWKSLIQFVKYGCYLLSLYTYICISHAYWWTLWIPIVYYMCSYFNHNWQQCDWTKRRFTTKAVRLLHSRWMVTKMCLRSRLALPITIPSHVSLMTLTTWFKTFLRFSIFMFIFLRFCNSSILKSLKLTCMWFRPPFSFSCTPTFLMDWLLVQWS